MLMTEVRKIPEILRRQKTRRRRRTIPEMSRAGMEWWKKKEREQNERYVQMMIEKVCSRKMSDVEPFDSRTKKKNQKMKRTFCFENCGDGELKRGCCLVFLTFCPLLPRINFDGKCACSSNGR